MAVNDPRVSSGGFMRRFQLENNWDIAPGESRHHIIEWVASVAHHAKGGKLKNLVLSCHGLPAFLMLGQGFDASNLPMFDAWRGLIEKIWLPDCLVARIPDAALRAQMARDYPAFHTGDGNVFCSDWAKRVHCYIVAPTEVQVDVPQTVPVDQMTSFEGMVLCYGPGGNVTWSGRNPSSWVDSGGTWHGVPD